MSAGSVNLRPGGTGPPAPSGSVLRFISRPWFGWVPVSQFLTVVVMSQLIHCSGEFGPRVKLDKGVASKESWDDVEDVVQAPVIRWASSCWVTFQHRFAADMHQLSK